MLNISQKIILSFTLLALLSFGAILYTAQQLATTEAMVLELSDISDFTMAEYESLRQSIQSRVHHTHVFEYYFFGILAFIFLVTGAYLWAGTIKPIGQLTAYLKSPDGYNNSFNIPFLKRKDEIGDFSRSYMETMIEREAAQALLRENSIDLQEAVQEAEIIAQIPEANSSPVIRISEEGQLIYFNEAALSTFPDLATRGTEHPILRNVPRVLTALHDQSFTGEEREIEYGGGMTYLRNITPIYTSHTQSLAIFVQDITKIKEVEKKAIQANAAKDEFLANMSHELRTPLNSILGITEILQKQGIDPEQSDMFKIVETSSQNLLTIVNDILDLSKIEAGEIALEYLAFDVTAMLEQTIDNMKPIAGKKGLEFVFQNDIEGDFFAFADPLRLSRILINLVNNAISYTEKGSVHVTATVPNAYGDMRQLRVDVRDTGIGIHADRIDTVFEKFTQADTSTTRKYGGTGLGLAITRELVEMMDGDIGVESEQGEGSVFWFEIPLEALESLPETSQNRRASPGLYLNEDCPPIQDLRVLLVEDQEMNLAFMEKLFQTYRIENFSIANDGAQALDLLNDTDFDLVLMDCHMPVMNGYEATQEIRAFDDPDKQKIPIIAMTANAMQKDIDKCFEVGMDAYIGKPFTLAQFEDVVSQWADFGDEGVQSRNDSDTPSAVISIRNSCFDLENLRANSMGDEDFVREIIGMFVRDSAKNIKTLETHCVDGECDDWVETAHALKGAAGTVGAEEMRLLCADAQNMSEATAEDRRKAFVLIEAAYLKVKAHLIAHDLFTEPAEERP